MFILGTFTTTKPKTEYKPKVAYTPMLGTLGKTGIESIHTPPYAIALKNVLKYGSPARTLILKYTKKGKYYIYNDLKAIYGKQN